jgi:hypothetical protein
MEFGFFFKNSGTYLEGNFGAETSPNTLFFLTIWLESKNLFMNGGAAQLICKLLQNVIACCCFEPSAPRIKSPSSASCVKWKRLVVRSSSARELEPFAGSVV